MSAKRFGPSSRLLMTLGRSPFCCHPQKGCNKQEFQSAWHVGLCVEIWHWWLLCGSGGCRGVDLTSLMSAAVTCMHVPPASSRRSRQSSDPCSQLCAWQPRQSPQRGSERGQSARGAPGRLHHAVQRCAANASAGGRVGTGAGPRQAARGTLRSGPGRGRHPAADQGRPGVIPGLWMQAPGGVAVRSSGEAAAAAARAPAPHLPHASCRAALAVIMLHYYLLQDWHGAREAGV